MSPPSFASTIPLEFEPLPSDSVCGKNSPVKFPPIWRTRTTVAPAAVSMEYVNLPVGRIVFPQCMLWDKLNCPASDICARAEDANPALPANIKIARMIDLLRLRFTPASCMSLCWRRRGLESRALNRYKLTGPLDRTSKFGSPCDSFSQRIDSCTVAGVVRKVQSTKSMRAIAIFLELGRRAGHARMQRLTSWSSNSMQ